MFFQQAFAVFKTVYFDTSVYTQLGFCSSFQGTVMTKIWGIFMSTSQNNPSSNNGISYLLSSKAYITSSTSSKTVYRYTAAFNWQVSCLSLLKKSYNVFLAFPQVLMEVSNSLCLSEKADKSHLKERLGLLLYVQQILLKRIINSRCKKIMVSYSVRNIYRIRTYTFFLSL